MKNKLLLFVPGYNVSKTIGKAITNLVKLREKLKFDVIYVDNNSTDNSVEIVQTCIESNKLKYVKIIQNKKNLGYGGSQKIAFNYAFKKNYDYLMEYDADLQYPHEAIPEIYNKIKSVKASIVFGSRVTKKQHSREMGFVKLSGNKLLTLLYNWAFEFNVSEIHTGFRIYDLNLINGVDFSNCHNDYRWTLDSVVEILKINKSFSEISIEGYYHKDKSSPSFKHLFIFFTYSFLKALKYKLFEK